MAHDNQRPAFVLDAHIAWWLDPKRDENATRAGTIRLMELAGHTTHEELEEVGWILWGNLERRSAVGNARPNATPASMDGDEGAQTRPAIAPAGRKGRFGVREAARGMVSKPMAVAVRYVFFRVIWSTH